VDVVLYGPDLFWAIEVKRSQGSSVSANVHALCM